MGKRGREEKWGPPRKFDDRQARKQADRLENDGVEGNFNMWFGPRKKRRGKDKAASRCDPSFDAGATRGSEAGALEFCIFFARGACARGYSCHKLHFVPTLEDDAREDNMHDCFGRERSGVEDDDRDGPGCFLKENRTLWVGGVLVFDEAAARERVRQNFGAWGRISSVRLVKNKSCAFVQYAYRANAEFAKEAMSNQALLTTEQVESNRAAAAAQDRLGKGAGPRRPPSTSAGGGVEDGPVLHVRWAAEDPNPRAVVRAREGHAQTLLAAQVATGALPPDVTGRLPAADRALLRKTGMGAINPSQVDLEFQNTQRQYLAVQGDAAGGGQYPNTDHQYPNTDHQYPNTDHQYPNTDRQYPSTDHRYPNRDHQYPKSDLQYPNTNHQYPNTYHQYPNTDNQYPSTDHQYLSTNHLRPGAAGARSGVGVLAPSSMRGMGAVGGGTSSHFAPAGGGPGEVIGGAGDGHGSRSDGDSTGARGLGGGSAERPRSPAVAAAGVVKGAASPAAVAGGSLSLLGGYESDDSD